MLRILWRHDSQKEIIYFLFYFHHNNSFKCEINGKRMPARCYKLTTVRRIKECGLPADEIYIKIRKNKAEVVACRAISRAPSDCTLEKISEKEIYNNSGRVLVNKRGVFKKSWI